jgi:hypothetical protein
MNRTIIYIVLSLSIFGCAYYPNLNYVEYEGVDYGYAHGSKHKIYYRDHDRVTKNSDKIIAFGIGAKKLREFNNDRAVAADTITTEVVKKEGFCAQGYTIDYHPTIKTGDHGFAWMVFCK